MRALVIDDSKPVRSILSHMFGQLGFDVQVSCDGKEALEQLEQGSLPDVVTVNWNMPVMDGVAFLKAVRQDPRYRELKVIMISVETKPDKITAAKQIGADDYLVKPLDLDTLAAALQRVGLALPQPAPSAMADGSNSTGPSDREAPRQDATRFRRACKVLVVDDSAVIRRTLTAVLNEDPEIRVVATAADGRIALETLAQVPVDVVLLDVEMPNMNGLEALRQMRKTYGKLPVIMFSSLTERGAEATLEALMLGANDYVPKPAGVADLGVAKQCICEELIPRIRQFSGLRASPAPRVPSGQRGPGTRPVRRHRTRVEVVVVGVSTGGPVALARLLPAFLVPCPVPVVIVQHMPPVFTRHLAMRLAADGLDVLEGQDGHLLKGGQAIVAPGGHHTVLDRNRGRLITRLNDDPPENSCRPAADVLFHSAASVCGGGTLAVVMTGMGRDGLRGCEAIAGAGGVVLAQDEPSSVVWGMPGQVVQAGLADEVWPLDKLGAAILDHVAGARKPA